MTGFFVENLLNILVSALCRKLKSETFGISNFYIQSQTPVFPLKFEYGICILAREEVRDFIVIFV